MFINIYVIYIDELKGTDQISWLQRQTCIFTIHILASILYKSIAGRYRPVSYPDGPITTHYRFIKNAYWDMT